MALPSFSQLGYLHRAFLRVLLFYIFGLGGTAVLARFVPIADMCNLGLPFLTGLATLVIGACKAVATIMAYLFGYRTATVKGMLATHSLLLVSIAIMILSMIHNA
jgi:hypothetical protein